MELHHLVTGGAGFVGSHLADALIARGDTVTVLDDLSTGRSANLDQHKSNPSLTFVEGSILDMPLVNSLVAKVDHVFHLAAAVGVFNIVQNPLKSLSTNIRGSENVLEACAKNKVPVLVTSTSEIYGKNTSDALGEEDDRILGSPLKVRWSYSEAKAIEEVLAYSYWHSEGLPARIVRLFNTVGPRQVGFYGMVVPRFIQSAIKNEPITIYGDGTQSRVFCHVQDAVKAILTLAATDSAIGEVYNIGGVGETTIKQLAEKIIERTKSTSTITFTAYDDAYPAGYEDMQRRVPDITKIKNSVGWVPADTLDNIIDDVAAEMKK